jgi:phosphoglycerate dehydrogenase-like enzyme
MNSPVHVLLLTPEEVPAGTLETLRGISPRLVVENRVAPRLAEAGDVFADVEVLYTAGLLPEPGQAPRLRWVQGEFAGVDRLRDHPLLARVTLTNASGIHAPVLGEYVLMMMLAFAHRLPLMIHYQQKAEWSKPLWPGFNAQELRGATVGIIGYGSIGREVARLARAFGMRVLALKRRAASAEDAGWRLPGLGDAAQEHVDRLYGPEGLADMLPECDYVVLALPLTPETKGMIGEAQLRLMKPEAVLVNVARGAIVDEPALIRALEAGRLGGAALDVFTEEPLPLTSPLWRLPNVLISPHSADVNAHYVERCLSLFADNLRRYVAGQPLLNVVDPTGGY